MAPSETLAQFANWKLAGDRLVRDVVQGVQSGGAAASASARGAWTSGANSNHRGPPGPYGHAGATRYPRAARRRRRYYAGGAGSTSGGASGGGAAKGGGGGGEGFGGFGRSGGDDGERVGALTDAELEAELAARRASRSRERARYARAMRSEKLVALEEELMRLRGEISRIDPDLPRRAAGIAPLDSRQNHAHVSWDLPDASDGRRYAAEAGDQGTARRARADPGTSLDEFGSTPPPPPPLGSRNTENLGDLDDLVIDPEQQRREKAERQRRREEKRKQREAAKKPMTLADIIRSAGPDPIRRLKPASKKPTDLEVEESMKGDDDFANLRRFLKAAEQKETEQTTIEEPTNVDKVEGDGNPVEQIPAISLSPKSTHANASTQCLVDPLTSDAADLPPTLANNLVPDESQKSETTSRAPAVSDTDSNEPAGKRGSLTTSTPVLVGTPSTASSVVLQDSGFAVTGPSQDDRDQRIASTTLSSVEAAASCDNDILTTTGTSRAPLGATLSHQDAEGDTSASNAKSALPVSTSPSIQGEDASAALSSLSALASSLPVMRRRVSHQADRASPTDLNQQSGTRTVDSTVDVSLPLSSALATKTPERMTLAERRLLRRSGALGNSQVVGGNGRFDAIEPGTTPSPPASK
jgi:hypothetical protein